MPTYRIKVQLDTTQLDAAAVEAERQARRQAAEAKRTADAQQRAADRAAAAQIKAAQKAAIAFEKEEERKQKAAERTAKIAEDAAARAELRDNKRRDRYRQQTEKSEAARADREKNAADRSAQQVDDIATRFLIRDERKRDRYRQQQERKEAALADRKADADVRATDRATSQRDRIMDRWVNREHNRQIRAAKNEIAEQERAAEAREQLIMRWGVVAGAMALRIGNQLAEISADIQKKAQEAGKFVNEQRDQLREFAALSGAPEVTNAVLGEAAKLQVGSGLPKQAAIDFAVQYKGSVPIALQKAAAAKAAGRAPAGITEDVSAELMSQSALMAQRLGGSAKTRGELAGLLGQFGHVPTAQAGLGQLEAIRIALTEGRGEDTPLTQQLLKAAGSLVREGGPIASLPELSAIIGVTSLTAGPEAAGERAIQLNRALKGGLSRHRKVKGAEMTQSQYLQGLGLKEKDSLETIMQAVFADMGTAAAQGRDLDAYLVQKGFGQSEERQAVIESFGNREQVFSRLESSRKSQDGGAVQRANEAFRASLPGQTAINKAQREAAQTTLGLKTEQMVALVEGAEASPEIMNADQSIMTHVADAALGVLTGHFADPMGAGRRFRVEGKAIRDVEAKARAVGLTEQQRRGMQLDSYKAGELYNEEYVNQLSGFVTEHGGPNGMAPDTSLVMGQLKDALTRQTEVLQENNRLMAAQQGKNNPGPVPGGPPPPIPARPGPNGGAVRAGGP